MICASSSAISRDRRSAASGSAVVVRSRLRSASTAREASGKAAIASRRSVNIGRGFSRGELRSEALVDPVGGSTASVGREGRSSGSGRSTRGAGAGGGVALAGDTGVACVRPTRCSARCCGVTRVIML